MTTTMPDWLAAGATEWVDEQLAGHRLSRTGPSEVVKVRAWSLVLRIPTVEGSVWFKANGGDTCYEAGLAGALARWLPDQVPVPLAIDASRGWQLTADGGELLRGTPAADDIRTWESVVAAYARMQRELDAHVDEMIALGVPDHRPHRMTALTTALIEDESLALVDDQRDRLRAVLEQYEEACAHLTNSAVSASLNHDDLHDGNVLVGRQSGFTFFDWGDSAVAFPFTTLLVTLRVLADRFALAPDDPQVLRVRDAYLDAYDNGLDRAEARVLARLATWTGKPGRALSWRRGLTAANPEQLAEFGDAVPGWLAELLEPGPL